MRASIRVALAGLLLVSPRMVLHAQTPQASRVQVTVVDPSGAVIPGADVVMTGLEPATKSVAPIQARTNDRGVVVFERLTPGRYSISGSFPGFDLGLLRDIRTRPGGDTRHVLVLPLGKLSDSVTVGTNTQEAAADRRSSEFGIKLSSEQIGALSDDPAELQRQLQELAGPDAVIRVDSFEGQQLPPKSQIKSIHVTRDQFAAEAANPGSTFVDIITQPGVGPIRGGLNTTFRDGSMTGKSQFTDRRGPEQTKNVAANIGGTVIANKTSFNASFNRQSDYTTPILNATLPTGTRAETLNIRQPNTTLSANAVIDHAISRDQTLRFNVFANRQKRENIGVGGYNLPDRAFSQEQNVAGFRVQEAGPIGRRTFINTRLSWQKVKIDMHSVTNAPTIVVQDAFTTGGAQNEQFADVYQSTLASDVDYVRGIHSWRAGVQMDGNWFTATSRFNFLGTYTFANNEDYLAGKPILYTRSLGFPVNRYSNIQGAVYVQDDVRVKKGLTFSPGLRYTMQTHVDDRSGFAPRFGVTWSPVANGATTLRASAGAFHGFLPLVMIEQTLRLDGTRQREIYITNPTYPDPGPVEALSIPTNKYVIGDFNLQRNVRYSAGLDQVLSRRMRVNLLYNYIHLQQQPRGRNVNPLVDGVRANPEFANIIEAVTDTEIRRHEFSVNALIALAPPGPPPQKPPVFDWRKLNMNLSYSLIKVKNNSDGNWAVPPTGNIEDDWGPGPADQPYRVQVLVTSNQFRNVTANMTFSTNAGAVYTQTTGRDDNHDGFVNDRPAGIGLRSLRGAAQTTLTARVQYAIQLSPPAPGTQPRYRLNLFVNVQNLTNHQNLGGYSGVMSSPYFMQPTLVVNPRRVDLGMNVTF